MIFEYWFMFPISILIATIAMAFGIGGAVLFSPVFIILFPAIGVTELSAADAFGAALLTEAVGFASGYIGYQRKKLIDYKTSLHFLKFGIPLAVLGTLIKRLIPSSILMALYAVGMFLLSLYVRSSTMDHSHEGESTPGILRQLEDFEGNIHEYVVCNHTSGAALSGVGGFFTGMISVGIGETVVSTLRGRCNLPMSVAAGTSVFVVISVVLVSSLTDIILVGIESVPWTLVMFTMPGVFIGGQVGSKLSGKINAEFAEKLLVYLFILIGMVMAYITILKFS